MNILHNSFFFFVFEQLNNYNNAYIDYSFSKILFYHVRLMWVILFSIFSHPTISGLYYYV